jgi:hypothetical protein
MRRNVKDFSVNLPTGHEVSVLNHHSLQFGVRFIQVALRSYQIELRRVDPVHHLQALLAEFEGSVCDHEDIIDLIKGMKDISVNDLDLFVEPRDIKVCPVSCYICEDPLNVESDFSLTNLQIESKDPIVDGRFPCGSLTDNCHVLDAIDLGDGVIDAETLERL